ncbi:MAG: hypothetical protein DI536_26610 [Archangium gephyra]|uniref:Uncharacterized protein n=1 Tax=Archangium gephyra TaxID=48 RepID=A0A2W5UWE0_9BACT|nr:MAG: hypothetical protein DI536_26610 [Archangium gephyra]
MKIDPRNAVTPVVATKAQPFKQLLSEARAELKKQPLPPKPVVSQAVKGAAPKTVVTAKSTTLARSEAAHGTRQLLSAARVHADGEAQRLGNVRSEHQALAVGLKEVRTDASQAVIERADARVLELITKELSADAPPANAAVLPQQPIAASGAQQAPKIEATPETKAAQAVALIEKIERFVKSQRPGLAITLNNSLGAHVEIERLGPRQIALKLVGKNGPPSAEAVSRIREELQARGLKVGSLSIA